MPKHEVDILRTSLIELVRVEALPAFALRNPNDALRLLDVLKAYGYTQLEGVRSDIERSRAAKFPPPLPATWPELETLRVAAVQHPDACRISPPAQSGYFAEELKADGLLLPEGLLELYAWADGFDISLAVEPNLPVFGLLPAASIDESDESGQYPRRAAVFYGGDEVQFSVYRDEKRQWWLVYEYEYEPIAKKELDLQALIRFAIRRMNAATNDALRGELFWDNYFEIPSV
ncbi:hypothetical protein LZC95_48395 [Pendulispora brunnea]|uniref:Uncharacterized protein n=1 Tax=Pendulispora brunnea TaxID=2905690 RepID=A0ABZ2K9L6_9BACT